MPRLRSLKPAGPITETHPAKMRSEALAEAANVTKRSADRLVEEEESRARSFAGFSGGSGLMALGLAATGWVGLAPTALMMPLAGIALVVPIVFAFWQALGGVGRLSDASYERGLCQAMTVQARRLGDAVGAKDQRHLPLGPEAIINGQLDILYRDLDRAKQRLRGAGDTGQPVRMHDRLQPHRADAVLTSSDGRRYAVHILDVSLLGVSIKGKLPTFLPSEEVEIGTRKAKVKRATPTGAALQFTNPILASEFNRKIIL